MLVPKKEADAAQQKFKQFKKFSLELYQKQYHIYENELTLTHKNKNINKKTIEDISKKIVPKQEASKPIRSIRFKVKESKENEQLGLLKKFDFNYHQTVNLPINEKLTFHLNTNVQTKNDFTLCSVGPALSYRIRHTSYRLGLTWGPQIDYYLMASHKLSTNWSAGVLVSLAESHHLSKSKLITTLRYKNSLIYSCLGFQNMIGLKSYPIHNDDIKLYINPYYGRNLLEGCTTGLSKKLSDISSIKLELNWTPWMIQFRSSILLKVTEWLKLFVAYDLQNSNAFINFGVKFKNFYLGVPIVTLDMLKKDEAVWVTPLIFGMTCLAIFWDRIRQKLPFIKQKVGAEPLTLEQKLEKRQKEINLISRRVREIYNEETRRNGLIIVESYYGSKNLIEQLIHQSQADKIKTLISEDYLHKVLDVTDSIRFYVDSSKLQLLKGSKSELYGFYDLDLPAGEIPHLYIRYTYQGEENERFFTDIEALALP